jgi:hypothetical protein
MSDDTETFIVQPAGDKKPVGRPPKQTAVKVGEAAQLNKEAANTADLSLIPSEEREKYLADLERVEQLRKPSQRNPFGTLGQKLALLPRPGYHTHWFNDTPGRIEEAKASGWSHRQDEKGKPLRRVVGTGRDKGALYAYAMDIPLVFWEEDDAARNRAARDALNAVKAKPVVSSAGTLKKEDREKFYTPREVVIERKI